MTARWNRFLTKLLVWRVAENVLYLLGLDNLVECSEFFNALHKLKTRASFNRDRFLISIAISAKSKQDLLGSFSPLISPTIDRCTFKHCNLKRAKVLAGAARSVMVCGQKTTLLCPKWHVGISAFPWIGV